jgi:hypothetical protein
MAVLVEEELAEWMGEPPESELVDKAGMFPLLVAGEGRPIEECRLGMELLRDFSAPVVLNALYTGKATSLSAW